MGSAALSAEGEAALQHLADVYKLSSVFEPCLLISPHGRTLDTIRRRLAEKIGPFERWEPEGDLPERVRRLSEDVGEVQERPVVWLQQRKFDRGPWQRALASLNSRREFYRSKAPWTWVLAGPPDLVPLIHEYAMHVLTGVAVRLNVLTEATTPLRWLHLSDLHFRESESWDRRADLQALLRHAEELKERRLRPDFLFVTGDVAWSGRDGEYEQAEHFLHKLTKSLELEPKESLFLVPGNHDVDRRAVGVAENLILRGLKNQDDVRNVQGDAQTMELLGRRLNSFYSFTRRLLGPARGWRPQQPWRVDVREVHGVETAILQLNSAWASGSSPRPLLGEAQLQQALDEASGASLKVALVHHSPSDLMGIDREPVERLFQGPEGVHFLLRGHLDSSRSAAVRTPALIELSAGAAYQGEVSHLVTHLLTEVDPAAGGGRVHFFRYSSRGRGFWALDTTTHGDAPTGVRRFELPSELRRMAGVSATSAVTEDRRDPVVARYRAAAAAVHGSMRFVGFPDHRPRPNVSVPELFVQLRLRPRRGRMDGTDNWTLRDLLRHLRDAEDVARVVVLGSAGSGKTTLCRFLVTVLAGEAVRDEWDIDDDILPVFLPVRDYMRYRRGTDDRSFIGFLAEQAKSQLQDSVNAELLERMLERGRCVFLFDGLDEAGSPAEREEICDLLEAFCRAYPRVSVLATSRFFDDSEGGVSAFTHLVLNPFDDEDLQTFIHRWYSIQEPDDPVSRDRGAANLGAALAAAPSVRELARLPLLATLVALAHRYEAHLPGERARLYDLCVKTLLETWPLARGVVFKELDAGVQRLLLEQLAYHMLSKLQYGASETIVEKTALVDVFLEMAHDRVADAEPQLFERWILFLENAGIFQERSLDAFSFADRSILEYLAARRLTDQEDGPEIIAEKNRDPAWHEVCLLSVGIRATDRFFLDRLYRLLSVQGGWPFLLRSMAEEASFDESLRSEILSHTARGLLGKSPAAWTSKQQALDRLLLSVRHGEWLKGWIKRELLTSRGETLQAVVALCLHREEDVLTVLRARPDTAVAAADLLDFWPARSVGRWAASALDGDTSTEWVFNKAADELATWRSLVALTSVDNHLAAPLLLGLVRSSAHWAAPALRPGLPSVLRVNPGQVEVHVAPRWPGTDTVPGVSFETPLSATAAARSFTEGFFFDFTLLFSDLFTRPTVRVSALDFARGLRLDLPSDFNEKFADVLAKNVDPSFHEDAFSVFVRDFARAFFQNFAPDSPVVTRLYRSSALGPPDESPPRGELDMLQRALTEEDERAAQSWIGAAIRRLATEAWTALLLTNVRQPLEERVAFVHHRVRNAWLLNVWPAVDARLSGPGASEALALYLALGWTQATTTGQWPATEQWSAILRGRPPAHWLPRSQWHLCWLLHDPEDRDHRTGLAEALAEGSADALHAGVAAGLQRLFGDTPKPTTPLARQEAPKTKPPGKARPIRWLHLCDLHLGSQGQELWWQIREELRESVTATARRIGPPDLVFFTGDLSNTGSSDELALIDDFLETLLGWLREATGDEGDPLVVPVPGNHDLARPSGSAAFPYRILDHYFEGAENEDVRVLDRMLWRERDASFLQPLFTGYSEWFERRVRPDLERRAALHVSHFPGDFTVELDVEGIFPLTIVGLNSTWLQYRGGSFEGSLMVPASQFQAALPAGESPLDVFRRSKQSLLLMHHPPSWLSGAGRRTFHESIYTPDRFALCLHGHLHEGRTESVAVSGGKLRYYFQGASLFGLEHYGTAREERAVGFSWGTLTADGTVRVWPLRRVVRGDGSGAFVHDTAFPEDPDGVRIRPLGSQEPTVRDAEPDLRSYLEDVLALTDYVKVTGISTSGDVKSALRYPIEHLYTPLRSGAFSGTRPEKSNRPEPLQEILTRTDRLLIEGRPGAGKTTFLRFVATMLARDALGIPLEGGGESWCRRYLSLELGGKRIPVLIRLADLAADLREEGATKRLDDRRRILDFLAGWCEANEHDISREQWRKILEGGDAYLLIDGLDEVADEPLRERLFNVFRDASREWPGPIVVTSRPIRTAEMVEMGFKVASIEPFGESEIRTFLDRWVGALHASPLPRQLGAEAERYRTEIVAAILGRPRIRHLATNPVMLTCLCVVHWHEGRLPEARSLVYRAVLRWLVASRRDLREAEGFTDFFAWRAFARLALAMAKAGRTLLDLGDAAAAVDEIMRRDFPDLAPEDRRRQARHWLRFEGLGSGVVEEVAGGRVRFWHLTFQEYLTALQLAWLGDGEGTDKDWWPTISEKLDDVQWREVVELLPGCLLEEGGAGRVDRLLERVLHLEEKNLESAARVTGIVGRLLETLHAYQYQPEAKVREAYSSALEAAMAIFTREGAAQVSLQDRMATAEALGRGDDPRLRPEEDNFLQVPGIAVRLGKYPVTVEEYQRFLDSRGYQDERLWDADGWSTKSQEGWEAPRDWEEKILTPNRPVVGVSWYESRAYCRWLSRQRQEEIRLPTSTEWEKAATPNEGRYPWGKEEPDDKRANYGWSVKQPTPVGIYPAGDGPYGHSDLAGNVWEWCADNDGTGFRALRGGSWHDPPEYLRYSYRGRGDASYRGDDTGFRLAGRA